MSNNQLLLQFLIAYMNWLHTGARSLPFSRNNGLCGNISRYFGYTLKASTLKTHIHELFAEDGMDTSTPFNDGFTDYVIEADSYLCHKNMHRNSWVQSQIERLQHEHTVPGYPETD